MATSKLKDLMTGTWRSDKLAEWELAHTSAITMEMHHTLETCRVREHDTTTASTAATEAAKVEAEAKTKAPWWEGYGFMHQLPTLGKKTKENFMPPAMDIAFVRENDKHIGGAVRGVIEVGLSGEPMIKLAQVCVCVCVHGVICHNPLISPNSHFG